MMLTLWALGGVSLLELALYSRVLWRWRRSLAIVIVPLLAACNGLLLAGYPRFLTVLVVFFSAYRVINLLRLVQAKMHEDYMRRVTLRTSLWLIDLQLLTFVVIALSESIAIPWAIVITTVDLIFAIKLTWVTMQQLWKTRPPIISQHLATRELPSLSVCIPARNETLNLEACLQSVLATEYPKLEVLVLDDSSHDRTPDIIKSFAHDGVRFIRGDHAPKTWLAKNWAYQRLFQEASGKYLLFCGVDARFEPTTFKEMIQICEQQKLQMLSLIPRNVQAAGWRQELSILLQPIRYAWELCLPRTAFGRPPVLSTCWLMQQSFMKQYGGLAAVSRMITPESYFARQAWQQQAYSFLQTTATMAVATSKSVSDQWDTAVRTRYPQLHKRPEFVALLSLAQLALLLAPLACLLWALLNSHWLMALTNLVTTVLLAVVFASVVRLTYQKWQWRGLLVFPLAVLVDIAVRHYSFWRYEFKEVVWKGRDVTPPVMHVEPHLPELP